MKHRDDTLYLRHILDAIARIEQYMHGLSRDNFEQNLLVQDGVIRQIMIIGEAAKLLSEELRAKYTDIPWRDMARMRDKLIHRYFGVNIEKVWLTVRDDLPVLRGGIARILEELQGERAGDRDE